MTDDKKNIITLNNKICDSKNIDDIKQPDNENDIDTDVENIYVPCRTFCKNSIKIDTSKLVYKHTGILIDMDDSDFLTLSTSVKPLYIYFKSPNKLNYEQIKYMVSCLTQTNNLITIYYKYYRYENYLMLPNSIIGGYNLISEACTNTEIDLDIEHFKIIYTRINNFLCPDVKEFEKQNIYTNYMYILYNKFKQQLNRYSFADNSTGRFGIIDELRNIKFTDFLHESTIGSILSGKVGTVILTYPKDTNVDNIKNLKTRFNDSKNKVIIEFTINNIMFLDKEYIVKLHNYTTPKNFINFIDLVTIDNCIPKILTYL